MKNSYHPPKFWTRLFEWLCDESFLEELQGDLEERYFLNQESFGIKRAKSVYRKEVIKMIRPSVLRLKNKLPGLFNVSLFRIHLVLSLRNLRRNKVYSAINILGLGAALSVCLFLVNMLYTGFSHDNQHPYKNRLYRITSTEQYPNGAYFESASSPTELEEILTKSIPEIETSAVVSNGPGYTFPLSDEPYWAYSILVDSTFFELFNFKTLEGNPKDIFDDLNSIVITEEIAQIISPNESALGKVTTNGSIVRAIVENPRNVSHMDFQVIGNRAISNLSINKTQSTSKDGWQVAYGHHYYVRLNKEVSRKQLDEKLADLAVEVNQTPKPKDKVFVFKSQLVSKITFGEFKQFDFGYTTSGRTLNLILLLGIIMLALASFNYTNLSMARAIQRTKEVGIRKIHGSTRSQIIGQFLMETVLFSILALGIGILCYTLISDLFPVILVDLSSLFTSDLPWKLVIWFFILSIGIGVLAGALPALYFAKIEPLRAINSRIKSKNLSLLNLRKVVSGFQLTVSMLFVLIITLGGDLYKQILTTDMGFKYDGLVTFKINPADAPLIKNDLAQIASIEAYALTGFVPGVEHNEIQGIINLESQDTISTYKAFADYDFGTVYKPKVIRGSSPEEIEQKTGQILVNPLLLQRMRIPLDSAVGKTLVFRGKDDKPNERRFIAGVMDNFVRNAIEQYKVPFIIDLVDEHPKMNTITLSVNSENLSQTLSEVETIFKQYNTTALFEPMFVDDQIEKSYSEFLGIIKAIGFLGGSIVFISLLGQLGIALYNAENRVKEIGIRKVLGAAITHIIRLLLKGSINTLILAFLIAAPLAYLFISGALIPMFAVEVHISVLAAIKGFVGLSALVLGVIVIQTWRTARLNPSESLKSE